VAWAKTLAKDGFASTIVKPHFDAECIDDRPFLQGPAVFAVFAGNYQRRTTSQAQESSPPAAQQTKEQQDNEPADLC